MKTTKTYEEIFQFNAIASIYIHQNPETPISEALEDVLKKQVLKIYDEYNDLVDSIKRNNCILKPNGAILYIESKKIVNDKETIVRVREHTPAQEDSIVQKIKELQQKKVVIHSIFIEPNDVINELINKLRKDEKEAFEGIVIPYPIKEERNKLEIVKEDGSTT